MSKLSNYSKFDHLDASDDEEAEQPAQPSPAANEAPPAVAAEQPTATTRKDAETGRYVFEYDGRKIYEWEQTLEEVNIYVEAPKGVTKDDLACNISSNRLQLGLKGSDRHVIDEAPYGKVKTSESFWYLDDEGIINITLFKVHLGETWESALQGQATVDAATKQDIQKDLLLERFQQENPGFDFQGAEVNGSVPDPRTFMGGISHE